MKQYLAVLKDILKTGVLSSNRTDTKTLTSFGKRMEFDLSEGFPLVTTKKVYFKAIVHELLWFIKGDCNIRYLIKNKVNIWNEWPFEKFTKSALYKGQDIEWFKDQILQDTKFAKKWGELGPVYGHQWRDFNGFDQLTWLLNEIKVNPSSRRLVISAWNPNDIPKMALPPCHTLFQFQVSQNKLNCQLYQRSADLFLGVPFNIASYALLTNLIAHVSNLKPGKFVHVMGDAHIYENHIDQVKEQISREPKKLAKLKLNPKINNLFDFKIDDIELSDYESWPKLTGKVAV
ncbi:thymidylate synthase [[Mycoplasma] testudinis]|uniref:thymidylate synthase n=1 Tax=[Mycoplasma] testudinis TaxID=33924 RepID=UPI0004845194|nr:thymidylate synthase [[Mycoplasma] testudinis]